MFDIAAQLQPRFVSAYCRHAGKDHTAFEGGEGPLLTPGDQKSARLSRILQWAQHKLKSEIRSASPTLRRSLHNRCYSARCAGGAVLVRDNATIAIYLCVARRTRPKVSIIERTRWGKQARRKGVLRPLPPLDESANVQHAPTNRQARM